MIIAKSLIVTSLWKLKPFENLKKLPKKIMNTVYRHQTIPKNDTVSVIFSKYTQFFWLILTNKKIENHGSIGEKTKTGGEKCKSSKGKLVYTAHIHMYAYIWYLYSWTWYSYSWTGYLYSCHIHEALIHIQIHVLLIHIHINSWHPNSYSCHIHDGPYSYSW